MTTRDPKRVECSGWMRRTGTTPTEHTCAPPMRERVSRLPADMAGGETIEHRDAAPDGQWNDLWRCACGQLWRVGDDCDDCDRYGLNGNHGTLRHVTGRAWRPATFWQRIMYRGRA